LSHQPTKHSVPPSARAEEFPPLGLALRPLPRLHRPAADELLHDWIERGRPVVVSGALEGWPAFERWRDLDALASRVGHRRVPVRRLDPNGKSFQQEMRFGDYLEQLRQLGDDERQLVYLAEVPLGQVLPELVADVGPSPYRQVPPEQLSVMMGRRTYAPLHYHPASEAFSTQVVGHKRFVLFPPSQGRRMQPKPWWSPMHNFGRVDLADGAPADAVGFAAAEAWETVLAPGEFLFIPVQWWHVVHGASAFNVLLVDFFPSPVRRWHFPWPGLPVLAQQAVVRALPRRVIDALGARMVRKEP
jgi:lysine-specific demethylase 8